MTAANSPALGVPHLFFHADYDISFYGLEKLHPFDSKKYGKVWRALRGAALHHGSVDRPVTEAELLLVHTEAYLEELRALPYLARALELPFLRSLPRRLLGVATIDRIEAAVLQPMRLAVRGTYLAAQRSLQTEGWAINLGGGYHHANRHRGHGFCLYADVAIAIEKLRRDGALGSADRVLLIDLDAHQGDGLQHVYRDDPRIVFLDFFNAQIFPRDSIARERIDYAVPLPMACKGAPYLAQLDECLELVLREPSIALVFYIAGTDVFREDPLGGLGLSRADIIERDARTVRAVRRRGLPLVYLLGGGYTYESSGIIAASLRHLLRSEGD
ncbi:MAG: histone deacetylase [Bacteroidota bacterium]